MFNITKKEMMWAGRKLTLETGKIARQADGAVLVTYGDTIILVAVTIAKKPKPGIDFFPLTVNYQEKTFAAGKIPGGFFKREGRPSEYETLTSRLIDRPIRPLFTDGFRNEVQVVCTTLAHDLENDPAVPAMIGVSAALAISGAPFAGPMGAARIGYRNGEYLINPTMADLETSDLDLMVAGTAEGILMVESEAKELSDEIMEEAVWRGHAEFQPVIAMIAEMAKECAKPAIEVPALPYDKKAMLANLDSLVGADIRAAYKETAKHERYAKKTDAFEKAMTTISAEECAPENLRHLLHDLEADLVRGQILDTGNRIDGRDTKTIRPIVSEVGVLPRAHGSALFTRGETQALVVATLGTGDDEQMIDSLPGTYRERFMLHYNMPPYSVGETGRMGSPGRREIGHGKLAWRAIHPLLPAKDKFPYTIRVVSEITESNGSSSMASVCGASLSMMDAGVPLLRPVAGIAMGLIKEGEKFAVLSDILGDEDHLGDMDFKVAGTSEGVTALQMDLKIASINRAIMSQAIKQAKDGRMHILGEMAKSMTGARGEVSGNAPRITTINVPKDKIREIIGTGGKVIREITATTGCKIDIEDDGTIKVASTDPESAQKAIDWIRGIACDPEVGVVYDGKVVKIMEFGAFVNFMGSRDGLVHISELAAQRVAKTGDVVFEGQAVKVLCMGMDDRGKVKLSMKRVDQTTGELIDGKPQQEQQAG